MALNSSLEEIERQVRSVSDLPRAQLVERWIKIYRSPPPKGISRRLLERAAAYHLQADALGGLKPAVARRLSRLAAGSDGPMVDTREIEVGLQRDLHFREQAPGQPVPGRLLES